jgi:hypothetical protein
LLFVLFCLTLALTRPLLCPDQQQLLKTLD